ncbi:MOSC domain-containing protein [Haloferula sp.]|uniref:MOSC domain-containing protein n=1 Tax=Haloferula sp. TaxID=2497595 RepID=UPI00329D754B
MTATILHLYTSPGHNYFGHHEKPPGTNEIIPHDSIKLVAGRGIPGDRFYDWKDNYKGQLTLLDQQVVEDIRAHAENPELPATAFRRNVVIEGLDLNSLIGKTFRLNGVLLEGSEECRPCYWMDKACGKPGTEALMKGRGGLRCRILEDGELYLGAAELVVDDPQPESR